MIDKTPKSVSCPQGKWDVCVIGNGISALWSAYALRRLGKSVCWVSSEEPATTTRATLQHGWCWNLSLPQAQTLALLLDQPEEQVQAHSFEVVYYDAKSSRRLKRLSDSSMEWGSHEGFLRQLLHNQQSDAVDVSTLHDRVLQVATVQLETDPLFRRFESTLLIELEVSASSRLSKVVFAGDGGRKDLLSVEADQFVFGDFEEVLPPLLKNEEASQKLANAYKGRGLQAGFSLHLEHKELAGALSQWAVVPLVVNPTKPELASHVVGRFVHTEQGLESLWFGLVTEEELEDNHEILKKLKSTKRALDRAFPGFAESIMQEAVSFEPAMCAPLKTKHAAHKALGAWVLTDVFGAQAALESVGECIKALAKTKEKVQLWQSSSELTPAAN